MIRLRSVTARKSYPSDVSDDEWALVAPYLTLLPEDTGQREHGLDLRRAPVSAGSRKSANSALDMPIALILRGNRIATAQPIGSQAIQSNRKPL